MRPFYCSSVDYAGPLSLRLKTLESTITKAYLYLFVCFATKALHIVLAHDLSTDAFLNCLRIFTSRRGSYGHLYSENDTNCVGARYELREL